MATIKKAKSNRHRKDSELYLLKKTNGRPPALRSNKAKEYTVKRVMADRDYITISAYTLGEIIDSYEFEKIRMKE